jgi:hypothetical protein
VAWLTPVHAGDHVGYKVDRFFTGLTTLTRPTLRAIDNSITLVVVIIIAVLVTITIITLGEEMAVRAAIIVVAILVADMLVADITNSNWEQEQAIASDTRPALILCYHNGSEARSSQRGA